MARHRIMILSEDRAFQAALAEQLGMNDAFMPVLAATLDDIDAGTADILLLDGRPDLCRALRDRGVALPIVTLGGEDAAPSLAAGASDHIAKPVRLGLLLARLRLLVQQDAIQRDARLPLGPYVFRPDLKLLTGRDDDREIRLTEKETAMLLFLLRDGARAVPRDTLLEAVWGYNSGVASHTLETHIYRLRQKIEADPAHAALLITEPGGYRLMA